MSGSHDIDSEDPLELFGSWLKQAHESEPNDPNAAALATSTMDGLPSVRIVLAKRIGEHLFCFFTNAESRKGMAQNPQLQFLPNSLISNLSPPTIPSDE